MARRFLFALLLFAVTSPAFSQDAKEAVARGDKFFSKKDYDNALKNYLQAYASDENNALINFKIGVCFLQGDKKSKSLLYLQKALDADPKVDQDIHFHLAMAYQSAHQFSKAISHYEEFKTAMRKFTDVVNEKIKECEVADSVMRHPADAEIINLSEVINTSFHEYSPLVSSDGSTLIFSSNRSTDAYAIKSGTNFEDIYISHKNGDAWSEPQKISPNINIKFNDAAASLSHDGKTLFLYYEEGMGDIYTSTKNDDGTWTEPVALNRNVNHPMYWETSASMSADGKKLFFSSNRPGGRGELDLWMSEMGNDGQWGKAVNLGPVINTKFNEDSPFLHSDGATLYFSSDGHPGIGSNDIFRSELVDGKWTKPVNLGFPINTIEYDGFFTLSDDKKTGFYSGVRDEGKGNADLYMIRFVEPRRKDQSIIVASASEHDNEVIEVPLVATEEKKEPAVEEFVDPIVNLQKDLKVVTLLKGKVIDEGTATPLRATITLIDNETNRIVTRITSNPTTGDFEIVIPHGGNYGVLTDLPGYLFNSINFNLPAFAEYQELDTHIIMVRAEVGSKVILKNIFFDIGKSDLKTESLSELERIRDLLEKNAKLKVQINGHTDSKGDANTNKALSLRRAESVVKYLVEKGISADRLVAKGFGAERPLVSNDDETEGREINRRTEIEITEAGGS